MTGLNCVKNGFPASYSLHSVDLLPSECPGYTSLTLTSPPGEIRVVHGSEELHKAVTEVVDSAGAYWKGDTSVLQKGEGWVLRFGEGADEDDGDDRLIFRSTKGCLLACSLLERIITNGWEVVASTELTTTPNFELCTWIIKKCSTPLYNGEVSCLVFDCDNKIRILGPKPQTQINNVVKRTIEKKWPKGLLCDSSDNVPLTLKKEDSDAKKSDDDMLEEIDRELKASRDGLDLIEANGDVEQEKTTRPSSKSSHGKKYKTIQDDPECPSEFELWGSPWRPTKDSERIQSRLLVIELIHSLFCRQWKLVTSSGNLLPSSSHDTLFFCRDGRILPALGGEKGLSALELERPNVVRLYNLSIESALKSAIAENWSPGLASKEMSLDHESEDVKSLICNEQPWRQNSSPSWEATTQSRKLTQALIKTMSANNLNLYGSLRMNRHEGSQSSLVIFRQSNISFSESLCLQLSGQNRLCIIGGGSEEKDLIRKAIETRWPYPVSQDKSIEGSQMHFFKVKRYPWANSYGHKDLDKIIKFAASILPPNFSLASPKNMDSDSGKSLILFVLKELSGLGWRLSASINSSSDSILAPYTRSTSQYCDPNSLYFMK